MAVPALIFVGGVATYTTAMVVLEGVKQDADEKYEKQKKVGYVFTILNPFPKLAGQFARGGQRVTNTVGIVALGAFIVGLIGYNKRGGFAGNSNNSKKFEIISTIGYDIIKQIDNKKTNKKIDQDEEFILGIMGLIELLRTENCILRYLDITKVDAKLLANELENIILIGRDIFPQTISLLMTRSEEIYSGRKEVPILDSEKVLEIIGMESVKEFYIKNFNISKKEMDMLVSTKGGLERLM